MGVIDPQLGTDAKIIDRRKDPIQSVPNFSENTLFAVFFEKLPFFCIDNFDNPEHWVIFSITQKRIFLPYSAVWGAVLLFIPYFKGIHNYIWVSMIRISDIHDYKYP